MQTIHFRLSAVRAELYGSHLVNIVDEAYFSAVPVLQGFMRNAGIVTSIRKMPSKKYVDTWWLYFYSILCIVVKIHYLFVLIQIVSRILSQKNSMK